MITKTVLENIARGSIPVKEDGAFDLSNMNSALQGEANKKNLTINIQYVPCENAYGFIIYREEGERK